MVTVQIRVSPFSRKILLTESGGDQPVRPSKADWLSDVLRIDRRDTNFRDRYIAALTTTIDIEVPEHLAQRLAAQGDRAGVVLHRLHIEQLSRHMISARMMGVEVKRAMMAFYDYYDIDEDDYSAESSYREYTRFRKSFFQENTAKTEKKNRVVVRRNSRFWQPVSEPDERPTLAHLRALIDHLDQQISAQRYRRRHRLMRQAVCYIYSVRGGMPPAEVGKRTGRNLPNVYKVMQSVRVRMRRDPEFSRLLQEVCSPAFVLPVPAPPDHLCSTEATDTRPSIPETPPTAETVGARMNPKNAG